jgi:chromosome partitioning protein
MKERKAKVTLVSAQKGGVGKTTTTINLASCLAMRATPILVIDIDPQSSTSDWVEMMKSNDKQLFEYINASHPQEAMAVANLVTVIDQNIHDYNHIIIDCPPRLEKIIAIALKYADLVLTACGVGAIDSWAFDDFNAMIKAKQAANHGKPIQQVFVSCVPPTWKKLSLQTIEHIEEGGFSPLQTIFMRSRICEAPGLGKATIHMDDEKATQEIETLTTQVLEILHG